MTLLTAYVGIALLLSAFRTPTYYDHQYKPNATVTTTVVQEQCEQPVEIEPVVVFEEPVRILTPLPVPPGHNTKTYACHHLFRKDSRQYALQQIATTDDLGFRRVGDAYCVALGTYYGTTIGDKYMITLENGSKFEVVLCDVKSDRHTDANHQYSVANGCMVEFYVEIGKLVPEVKNRGSVSALPEFDGCVTSIEKIEGENVLW